MSANAKKAQTSSSSERRVKPMPVAPVSEDEAPLPDLRLASFGRPALVRHAVAQGAERVSRQTHDRVDNLAKHYLYCLVYTSTRGAKSNNKRTINEQHILAAARRYGIVPAGFEFIKKKGTKGKGFANRAPPTKAAAPTEDAEQELVV